MKKWLIAVVLALPLQGYAEHIDFIELKLKDGCSLEKLLAIRGDFNEWAKEYGYQAKIAVPLQSENLQNLHWLGTSADAGTFGKAWDAWRDALNDPDSAPAKLSARFQECSDNLNRRGYDVY